MEVRYRNDLYGNYVLIEIPYGINSNQYSFKMLPKVYLMGIVGRTLRQNNLPEQADEMARRIFGGEAANYHQALAILMEYVEIVWE